MPPLLSFQITCNDQIWVYFCSYKKLPDCFLNSAHRFIYFPTLTLLSFSSLLELRTRRATRFPAVGCLSTSAARTSLRKSWSGAGSPWPPGRFPRRLLRRLPSSTQHPGEQRTTGGTWRSSTSTLSNEKPCFRSFGELLQEGWYWLMFSSNSRFHIILLLSSVTNSLVKYHL